MLAERHALAKEPQLSGQGDHPYGRFGGARRSANEGDRRTGGRLVAVFDRDLRAPRHSWCASSAQGGVRAPCRGMHAAPPEAGVAQLLAGSDAPQVSGPIGATF
jgi:hypothetical protein